MNVGTHIQNAGNELNIKHLGAVHSHNQEKKLQFNSKIQFPFLNEYLR